jgi:hypothetical protein
MKDKIVMMNNAVVIVEMPAFIFSAWYTCAQMPNGMAKNKNSIPKTAFFVLYSFVLCAMSKTFKLKIQNALVIDQNRNMEEINEVEVSPRIRSMTKLIFPHTITV